MLAVRAQDATSGLGLQQVPIPSPGPNDVLVKVHSAGITTGVLRLLRMGQCIVPTTVGHEAAGVIVELGDHVNDGCLAIGDCVRVHPMFSCGRCYNCQRQLDCMCEESAQMGFAKFCDESALYTEYHDGVLAEYVRVPRQFIDRLPDNVSFDAGAKMHDVATALRVLKMADIVQPKSTIIITAPTGTMGTVTLKLIKFFPNISKIILVGRSKDRLESVRQLTPVQTVAFPIVEPLEGQPLAGPPQPGPPCVSPIVQNLKELAPEGIAAIIDYIPAGTTVSHILPSLVSGGTLVHVGANPTPLLVPLIVILGKCWRILGNRGHTREDAHQILGWLSSGDLVLQDLITHRFRLRDVHRAIQAIESREEQIWMSLVEVVPRRS
ncbi:chaperonin 10-like protein [Aspergillus egyptiacus]|nr:chaperonin 10-like protein [Aspergillus egyptiacus]